MTVCQIDTLTLGWATHRLAGVATPANAAYSAPELEHQLRDSGAKALFTCLPLLVTALEAAKKAGIPKERVYLFDLPEEVLEGKTAPAEFKTLNQLVQLGESLPALEALRWAPGQGAKQCAYLCYSSGTSGLPVGPVPSS